MDFAAFRTAMAYCHCGPFERLPRELRDKIWKELLTFKSHSFRRVNRVEVECLGDYSGPFGPRRCMIDRNCANGKSGRVVDLRVFLVNRCIYEETSFAFYSSNEFITDTFNFCDARRLKSSVRVESPSLVLEGHLVFPPPSLSRVLSDFSRLQTVTIHMPNDGDQRTTKLNLEPISLYLALALVKCLSQGIFKRLRLAYYHPRAPRSPDDMRSIKLLRRASPTSRRNDRGFWAAMISAWIRSKASDYHRVLNDLGDNNIYDFIARFEDKHVRSSQRKKFVVVLSRLQDEPTKNTVPRPKLAMLLPSKRVPSRKRDASFDVDVEDNITHLDKIARLHLPQFLAFSESRKHKLGPDAYQQIWNGSLAQLDRQFETLSILP